jgi:hypothetical protein
VSDFLEAFVFGVLLERYLRMDGKWTNEEVRQACRKVDQSCCQMFVASRRSPSSFQGAANLQFLPYPG